MVETEWRGGGGFVRKVEMEREDSEWLVENTAVGGHSTDEIRISGHLNPLALYHRSSRSTQLKDFTPRSSPSKRLQSPIMATVAPPGKTERSDTK